MHLRFSQDIKSLLEKLANQPLTLSDVLAETSERGFTLVIGLLVLPFLLPMPPGFTTILGSACLLLSCQMALGRRSPWLPKRMAQFRFPSQFCMQMLSLVQRLTKIFEKITRPRWLSLSESPRVWQVNGLCITWLTLLLMLPIPMTNPIPTIGILLFVIAMLETDGLLLCMSYIFMVLTTAVFAVIFYLLWRAPELLQNLMN